jgi:hypothetical protein
VEEAMCQVEAERETYAASEGGKRFGGEWEGDRGKGRGGGCEGDPGRTAPAAV